MTKTSNPSYPALDQPPPAFGVWKDAEILRQWSFARRSPQQRLDWLIAGLALAYKSGALKPSPPSFE